MEEQRRWWSVDATTEALVDALLPMQQTSLGPLAGGRTLAEIALADRLRELDFEFPLAGGDQPAVRRAPGRDRRRAAASPAAHDPMRAYADRLESPALGDQALRGYLSGSIDVVLRVGAGADAALRRRRLQDQPARRLAEPLTALDYTPALMTAGDAALALPAPGAALQRGAAPLPALAAARLRPRAAPRRHPLPLRARHVRPGDPGRRRAAVRRVQPGSRRRAMVLELSDLLDGRGTARSARASPMIDDPHDRRLALGATGLLRDFNRAEVLHAADVHVALRLGALLGETGDEVLLATALAVRAVRHGSICVDLATVADLPLERRPRGAAALARAGPGSRPCGAARWSREEMLRLVGTRLYLDRYWREEGQVCDDLLARLRRTPARGRRARRSRRGWSGSSRATATPSSAAAARAAARLDHRAHRRSRHRQDHDRRRPAGAARRAAPSSATGRPPRIALAPPPARPRPGSRRRWTRRRARPRRTPPTGPARRAAVLDAAPAARLAPRQPHPLPPRPRQPAAATTSSWSTRPRWSR